MKFLVIRKGEKMNLKLTAKDQDGTVLYEGKSDCNDWGVGVLWNSGLEDKLSEFKDSSPLRCVTITAERTDDGTKITEDNPATQNFNEVTGEFSDHSTTPKPTPCG